MLSVTFGAGEVLVEQLVAANEFLSVLLSSLTKVWKVSG